MPPRKLDYTPGRMPRSFLLPVLWRLMLAVSLATVSLAPPPALHADAGATAPADAAMPCHGTPGPPVDEAPCEDGCCPMPDCDPSACRVAGSLIAGSASLLPVPMPAVPVARVPSPRLPGMPFGERLRPPIA